MRRLSTLWGTAELVFVTVHLTGCSPSLNLSECFNGTNNVQLIASAQSVTAWRTAAWLKGDEKFSYEELYTKAGTPVSVPPDLAAQLKELLLDKESYDFHPGSAKSSIPEPCVVITFSNSTHAVDVFISFADDSLKVRNDQLDIFGHAQFAGADFDPSHSQLLRIVKKIFSADARMQALSEAHSTGALWPDGPDASFPVPLPESGR